LHDTLLVLTGQRYAWIDGDQGSVKMDGVCSAGYVSDEELRSLYEHALALVSPSHYEGFGLPPVEAMSLGCPAIIGNSAATVEICGDAALQCNPDDTDEISRLMRLIHDDPGRRAELIAAGRARAARFTWRATTRMLLDLCLDPRLQSASGDRDCLVAAK
jgi:glycosyltransferase involved in cell wall biosynthesis